MTKSIQIKNMSLGSGLPKICVPLTGKTRAALYEEAAKSVQANPDLVEWRADAYEDLYKEEALLETLSGLSEILKDIPILFTIRTSNEGGPIDIAEADYEKINLQIAKNGKADLIDVEIFWEKEAKISLIQAIHEANPSVTVIASSHDFAKTDAPAVLKARFLEMDKTGADVLKMAVMPRSFEDVLAILGVTYDMVQNETSRPVISMSMGHLGTVSRIIGELSGSALTFGTIGAASAPGQIPMDIMKQFMEVLH